MAIVSKLRHCSKMKIKHLVLCGLLFAIAAAEVISADEVLTIDAAVKFALENNLSLLRSSLDVQAKKHTADNSWNSLLPTVNAGASISHPTSITGPVEPASRDVWTPGFSVSAGLGLSVSIIDNIKKAKADYEMGLIGNESARQELELQVRKLFYQILLLDANRELAMQNFTSAQARYEQSAALVRAGQAPRLDELSARVDMENLRPTMTNAQILYENAIDSFKTILGFSQDIMISLDGSLYRRIGGNLHTSDSETSGTPVSGSLASGMAASGSLTAGTESGLSWNPNDSLEAASLSKSIQSMEAQRNAAKSSAYIPSLRLSWNASPQYSIDNKSWSDNGNFSVSLSLSLDNFLPWSSAKTQIDNLDDSIRSAQIQLTDVMRNRENRIISNTRTIERILESLEAMNLNVELAQTTYGMYEEAQTGRRRLPAIAERRRQS